MSIGPSLPATSAAATPLAQAAADLERARHVAASHAQQVRYEAKAESAGGVATPGADENVTRERDADGRTPWETPAPVQTGQAPLDDRARAGGGNNAPDDPGRQFDATV